MKNVEKRQSEINEETYKMNLMTKDEPKSCNKSKDATN